MKAVVNDSPSYRPPFWAQEELTLGQLKEGVESHLGPKQIIKSLSFIYKGNASTPEVVVWEAPKKVSPKIFSFKRWGKKKKKATKKIQLKDLLSQTLFDLASEQKQEIRKTTQNSNYGYKKDLEIENEYESDLSCYDEWISLAFAYLFSKSGKTVVRCPMNALVASDLPSIYYQGPSKDKSKIYYNCMITAFPEACKTLKKSLSPDHEISKDATSYSLEIIRFSLLKEHQEKQHKGIETHAVRLYTYNPDVEMWRFVYEDALLPTSIEKKDSPVLLPIAPPRSPSIEAVVPEEEANQELEVSGTAPEVPQSSEKVQKSDLYFFLSGGIFTFIYSLYLKKNKDESKTEQKKEEK